MAKHKQILTKNDGSYWSNKFTWARLPMYLGYLVKLALLLQPEGWLVLATPKRPVKLVNGLTYKLGTLVDLVVLKEVFSDNCYERGVKITKSDKTLVDVGAGFGDFSIWAAKRFPSLRIYAFEPDKHYFKLLEENIKLNNVSNITPLNIPATPKNLFIPGKKLIKTIDFLKIDCEGEEFNIFGKLPTNDLRKIKKVAMEYHEKGSNTKEKIQAIFSKYFKTRISPKDIPGLGMMWAYQD